MKNNKANSMCLFLYNTTINEITTIIKQAQNTQSIIMIVFRFSFELLFWLLKFESVIVGGLGDSVTSRSVAIGCLEGLGDTSCISMEVFGNCDVVDSATGTDVGPTDGLVDGNSVGVSDGVFDGLSLGWLLGSLVGFVLGKSLGVLLGILLGIILGLSLGTIVGSILGI